MGKPWSPLSRVPSLNGETVIIITATTLTVGQALG